MDGMFVLSPNSYASTLTHSVVVSGGGPFGGDWVMNGISALSKEH